jgi:hypothetical protein
MSGTSVNDRWRRAATGWLLAAALASAAPAAIVGYWRFEEGSGSMAGDASGNDNDGTLAGNAAFISNVMYPTVDGAANLFSLALDGSGDSVEVPDDAALDLPASFTVEAFVRRGAGNATSAGVVVRRNPAGNSAAYGLIFGSPDAIRAAAEVASPGSIGTTTVPLAQDVWHHVAAVYDGATLALYLDGAWVGSVPGSGNVVGSSQPLEIGRFGADFAGRIDEVRISDSALHPSEFLRARIFSSGFEAGFAGWSNVVQ